MLLPHEVFPLKRFRLLAAWGCRGRVEGSPSLHQEATENVAYNPAFTFSPVLLFPSYSGRPCTWQGTHDEWLSRICLPTCTATASFFPSPSLDFHGSLFRPPFCSPQLLRLGFLPARLFLCLSFRYCCSLRLYSWPFFLLTLHVLHQPSRPCVWFHSHDNESKAPFLGF